MNWFGTFEKTVQLIRDYYWIALIPIVPAYITDRMFSERIVGFRISRLIDFGDFQGFW